MAADASPTGFRVNADGLTRFVADVFNALGLPSDDCRTVAELMVDADLTGAEAHGAFRLPQYARRLRAGGVNANPDIKVTRTAAATATVDGDNGMGHLVMSRAAETAVELARDSGIGWVGVRRSNHAGPAALYPEKMLAHGMVGIYSAVASANHMAVWGGAESLLGTNPLAIAIPAGEEPPFVLDMATTVVSYGTVKNTIQQEKPIPPDWLIDKRTGAALTDPAGLGNALLLPIGGYKGSGLALALGLLAGTLNGAQFGRDVIDFNYDDTSETNTGQFLVAINISRFISREFFAAAVDRHLRDLRSSAPLPGSGPIRIPGERRDEMRRERLRSGIQMPAGLAKQLSQLGVELGVVPLELIEAGESRNQEGSFKV